MKQIIKLLGVVEKDAKNGKKYKSFQTEQGNMSCFEENEIKQLMDNVGGFVEVEVLERNNFKNITKFYNVVETPVEAVKGEKQVELTKAQAEPMFRINIKTSAKGLAQWEVTIRADSLEEAKERLNDAVELAQSKCNSHNEAVLQTPQEVA